MSEITFETTFISMINFLFCTVLSSGAFKLDQTHKFYNFLDLTNLIGQWFNRNKWCQQCFLQQLWTSWVMTNYRRCIVYSLGASKVDQETIFSTKWLNFANFRLFEWKLCILESLSWSSKLFITSFLTTLISTITLPVRCHWK